MGTGTVVLVVLAVLGVGTVVGILARAGRREAEAEKARLKEQARVQALRSLESIWATSPLEFEEYIAELCRRDGCTGVLRVGAANDLGADVTGRLPEARSAVQALRETPHRR
ncbi:restriction endonuclease [Streptomyces sp. NPDC059355]|uniref:restriction endonuclease n=1 Tax=Streptomyces sp. NPDC059355 TaxID=3346811 RepID=UPI00367586B1